MSEHQKVLDEGRQYLQQHPAGRNPLPAPSQTKGGGAGIEGGGAEFVPPLEFRFEPRSLRSYPEGLEIKGDYYSISLLNQQIDNPLVTNEQLDSAQLSAQTYESKGQFAIAEQLYERILNARTLYLKQSQVQKASTIEALCRVKLLNAARGLEKDKDFPKLLSTYDQILSAIAYAKDLHLSTKVAILNPIMHRLESLNGEHEPRAAEVHLRAQQMINSYKRSLHCLEIADELSHTAWLLEQNNSYPQAEKLYRQALAIKQKNLGLHDPDTLAETAILARLCADQGKYDQADEMYEHCLAGYGELGRQDCSYAVLLENYADMLNKAQKHAKADKIYSEAQAVYKKIKASAPNGNNRQADSLDD
jgi:tetratricopeptide (TPR) repeat protein